jgi:phospholipid/cholesterol/gamma-HCH transport system substrate-binding protein
MNRGTEIRVGLTVVLGLAILIVGIMSLSNYSKTRTMRIWHVRFPQTGGLGAGDEVQVNGMRKGAVRTMSLHGDGVIIDLGLSREIQLTRACRVAIRNHGLMGEKVIAVDLRIGGEAYSTRDTIPGEFEQGMPEVMASLGVAVNGIKSLAVELDSLASSVGAGGMVSTLQNVRRTSEQLRLAVEENRADLHATVQNFAATARTTRAITSEREAQIKKTLDHFATAAEHLDRLSGRLDSLRSSLQSVATKLDKGQGSLGRMVNDDQLYTDLATSAKSLRVLIEDLRQNPHKYFKFSVFK